MRRAPFFFVLLLLGGCATLYTQILHQDDPAAIIAVPPEYALPFPASADGFFLIQGVGGHFSHRGGMTHAFDWGMPEGTPVLAAREGVVVHVEVENGNDQEGPIRYRKANQIKIRHPDGTTGVYAHLAPGGARVVLGERVAAGQWIGLSGSTGFSTEPHLHFHAADTVGRSVPIAFTDAPEPNGIPRAGRKYRGSLASPAPPTAR